MDIIDIVSDLQPDGVTYFTSIIAVFNIVKPFEPNGPVYLIAGQYTLEIEFSAGVVILSSVAKVTLDPLLSYG